MRRLISLLLLVGATRAWGQPTPAPPEAGSAAGSAAVPLTPEQTPEHAAPTSAPTTPVVPPQQEPATSNAQQKSDALDAVPPPPVAKPTQENSERGFRFGSYGRVLADTDLRGGQPEQLLVGAYGPRIVEDSYVELEFSYGFERMKAGDTEIVLRPVFTLAIEGDLFHDTGVFDSMPAIRNLYLEARFSDHLTGWAGSRMYRGDDIYLFDMWPLDNLNTLGAGVQYRTELPRGERHDAIEVALHGGVNRDDNDYQYQTIDVPNPAQGEAEITQLNRQRLIASLGLSYIFDGGPGGISIKAKVYGEAHHIGSGQYQRDDMSIADLPSDGGYLVGAEVSFFGMQPLHSGFRRHLNLFMRYAKGLAAFDPLQAPSTFGPDLKTTLANELLFGVSGNWDAKFGNLMLGVLSRRFIDASGEDMNPDDGWEYALDARPLGRLSRDWYFGADVSYQARFPQGLNPITLRAEDPGIFQIAPMFVFSPMGPSGYDRPQIRFVYRAAYLNQGALDDYVPGDVRQTRPWEHYLGVQAEWWFNSSSYSR
ncbi:MAG TPA: carbohydrate porin [Kofleriaceae bacterium]|jgi:maltoporin